MFIRKWQSWMGALRGMKAEQITVGHALELAKATGTPDEILFLTNLERRGITFLDISEALNPKEGVQIRGDRRSSVRATPDRRARTRTPGRFKDAEDAAYAAIRRITSGGK